MRLWHKLALSGASAAVMALALAAHFEGTRYRVYHDIGGVPTICNGHTRGVKMGDTATQAQCDAYLKADMSVASDTIDQCYPSIPAPQIKAALDDLAFNVGPGRKGGRDGVCFLKSGKWPTIRKRAAAGDWRGVCDGLLEWNKAAGQVLPGLTERRQAERTLCLAGAAQIH